MRKLLMLAVAHIRKNKNAAISFALLTLVAALLLNLGLVTWMDYDNAFDKKAEMLHSPHVSIVAATRDAAVVDRVTAAMADDNRATALETRKILLAGGSFSLSGGEQTRKAMFQDCSLERTMGDYEIVERAQVPMDHGIFLPYLFSTGSGYKIGDDFDITLTTIAGAQTFSFIVAGFYEDVFYATINNTTTGFLLEHDAFVGLEQAFSGAMAGTLITVKMSTPEHSEGFASQYLSMLDKLCPANTLMDSNYYAMVKSARTITSSIGASIVIGFSVLLFIIALVVMNFRIRSSVAEEIKDIGALGALGYTSRQLIGAILVQFSILALIGCVLGTILSYPILPGLASMFAAQTGMRWEYGFSWPAAGLTFFIVCGASGAVALASSMGIRKLPPMAALRTGLTTHSFLHNYFPLHRGRAGLVLKMAGKQMTWHMRQNLLLGVIIAGIAFASVFAGTLFYNINVDSDAFLRLVSGVNPHVTLEADSAAAAESLMTLTRDDRDVAYACYFRTESVVCDDMYTSNAYVSDDLEAAGVASWLYKGRFPQYGNETAIGGLLAKLLKKDVGDTISMIKGDVRQEYLITGLIQGSNNMGRDLCLTTEGYMMLDAGFAPTVINVYLNDGAAAQDFIARIRAGSQHLLMTTDMDALIRSSMQSYKTVVAILAAVIGCIMLLVIGLVLHMIIRAQLTRQRQMLAVQKAMGFTTGQLVLQNALALTPVIGVGTIVGSIAGNFGVNPFLSVLFSGIGIMKVGFTIRTEMIVGLCAGIILAGFILSLLAALRLRRITPYTLLSE